MKISLCYAPPKTMCSYQTTTAAVCTWAIFALTCLCGLVAVCPMFGMPSQHYHSTITADLETQCRWIDNRLQIEKYYTLDTNNTAVYLCRPVDTCSQQCNTPITINTVCVSGWYGCYPLIVSADLYTGRNACMFFIILNGVVFGASLLVLSGFGIMFLSDLMRRRGYLNL